MSTFDCPICFDTVASSDAAPLCSAGHRFCAECNWRCCQSALSDGLVPACPNDKEARCGVVPHASATAALTCWLREPSHRAAGWTSEKVAAVYLSAERARQGAVQCIGRNCPAYYVPPVPHAEHPQRLQCTVASCGASFCSACRHPFHYRSSCAEALRLSARWVRFLQAELPAFLQSAMLVDAERWAPVLKAYTQSKSSLDEAARDALSRFDELRKMELWKEKHCKRCPSCRRVVEKLEGCDMMMCGDDVHGGNQQRGCGKAFVWCEGQPNSAIKYEADLRGAADYAAEDGGDGTGASGDEERGVRERRLRRDATEEHQARPGVALLCDGCALPIVGPRLQCVHCEGGVDLCVGCVGKAAHGRGFRLHDGRKHPRHHCFRRVRPAALSQSTATAATAAAAATATQSAEAGLVELTASSVDRRPGLSTARAAAALAAEARAVAARAAAGGGLKRPCAAQQPSRSSGGGGGSSSAAVELSDDDDGGDQKGVKGARAVSRRSGGGASMQPPAGAVVIDLE